MSPPNNGLSLPLQICSLSWVNFQLALLLAQFVLLVFPSLP